MKLYHGTNVIFDEIDLNKSLPFKDFGRGFYLSPNKEQAEKWAKYKQAQFGGEEIVMEYDASDNLWKSGLNVLVFDNYTIDWLDFVLLNRQKGISHDFDIVYGPIADDNVGLQIRQWQLGGMNKDTLLEKLKYSKGITFQYLFGSLKALELLKK